MINNIDIGNYGETLALNYLLKNGYKLRRKNFRTIHGEIDLIVEKDDTICFVEVKTRYNNNFGLPCQCIDSKKKKKIIKTSLFYLATEKLLKRNVRYDVIEVSLNYKDDSISLNYIESAF